MIKEPDFLLLGGGIASSFAADALRKEGAVGNIVILSAEDLLPYSRFQLPRAYLFGKRNREQLLMFEASHYQKND